MKTPRIEELVEEYRKRTINFPRTKHNQKLDEKWLEQALTEAHQAGIDEVVGEAAAREKQLRDIHKTELDTISCMSLEQFVVWSNQRKQPKYDTIKALQDNK